MRSVWPKISGRKGRPHQSFLNVKMLKTDSFHSKKLCGRRDFTWKSAVLRFSRGHMTYCWNVGSPSISREWFELETSNLACRLITGGTNDKNEKLGQRGPGKGDMTYFWISETLSISREWFQLETSNLAFRLTRALTIKMNNEVKEGPEGVTWPAFWILGPPPYLENGLSKKLQIWHADWPPGVLTIKMNKKSPLSQTNCAATWANSGKNRSTGPSAVRKAYI